MKGLHVMTCAFYLIDGLDSRIYIKLVHYTATALFNIFHGQSSKLQNQDNHFHEFWTDIQLDMNFQILNQFK
jgi:hypothetical protein